MPASDPQVLDVDVAVIGGGPAGASAATVLAEKGHRTVILEREAFPRYRVGESLIPHCWHSLERLGLNDSLDTSKFVVAKHSVQFVSTDGTASTPFYFFKHTDHPSSRTWQVVRSEFDQMLIDNAKSKGAEFRDQTSADELIHEDDRVVGVRATGPDGRPLEVRAKMTVDASGRDLFAQHQLRWRVSDPKLRKIAIWTYYKGAKRDPGIDEGATTIAYIPDKGWFWYLPLANDVVSVGVVAERKYLYRSSRDLDEIFRREAEQQPWIADHLRSGEKMRPCQATGDFSYRSRFSATDGLVLAGDAFAFLDPVFSSGVFLALQSGIAVGDAIDAGIHSGDLSASAFEGYTEHFIQGIEAMRRLVYAFYDRSFNFGAFLAKYPQMQGALTDCLIGNVSADLEPLFEAMKEFADIPSLLKHGRPQAAASLAS